MNIDYFEGMGRGLIATGSIDAEENVMFIPKAMIMSHVSMTASSDPVLSMMAGQMGDSEIAIVSFLLMESLVEDSFWRPYFNVLPTEVPNLSFFSEESLLELQNDELVRGTKQRNTEVQADYNRFLGMRQHAIDTLKSARHPVKPTLEQYRWAVSVIDSRGKPYELNLQPYDLIYSF